MNIHHLGLADYETVWARMRAYTASRGPETPDAVWLVEHPPVYTLGLGGLAEHLHDPGEVPVVRSDRGGQVTYHGPGQLVVYVMLDLARLGLGVRETVRLLERVTAATLAARGIAAERRPKAPGVYVRGAKIASLGLRVRRGCTYHGLALNVDMDLSPFERIDPCGYPGLAVTDCRREGWAATLDTAAEALLAELLEGLRPSRLAALTA